MLKKALTCAAVAIVIASVAPGCSDPEPATPQVIIESEALSPGGSDGSQKCQVTGSWINIGTFADITDAGTDPKPRPGPGTAREQRQLFGHPTSSWKTVQSPAPSRFSLSTDNEPGC